MQDCTISTFICLMEVMGEGLEEEPQAGDVELNK